MKESIQKYEENELARVASKGGQTIEKADRTEMYLRPIDTMDASNFAFDLRNSSAVTPGITFRLLKGLMKHEETKLERTQQDFAPLAEGVIDLS